MRYLVDTCGWIEWLTDGKLAASFEPYLAHPEELIVPTLIQYELYKWICREKDATLALEVIGITENGLIVPMDTALALSAAGISKKHNLSMADAVIFAASRHHNVLLVTSDQHFKHLPNIKYLGK